MEELSLPSLLGQNHPLFELPPLWGLIYYEGIYGNHILFVASEVAVFEAEPCPPKPTTADLPLEELGFRLSQSYSYRAMVDYLTELTYEQRYNLFLLYKIWLHSMSEYLKSHAH